MDFGFLRNACHRLIRFGWVRYTGQVHALSLWNNYAEIHDEKIFFFFSRRILLREACKAHSSTPTFPENHLIERLAPVWFWRVRLLATGERIAKGDRDIKVEIVGNTEDRFGFLRLPH